MAGTSVNNAKAWLEEVVAMCEVCKPAVREDSGESYAMIEIATNKEKNIYPLKVYPNVITHGLNYLKKKGLFPDHDSDDDAGNGVEQRGFFLAPLGLIKLGDALVVISRDSRVVEITGK